jgi:hypothetical protein
MELFIWKSATSPWQILSQKPEYPERTTDHGQATGKLYHLRLQVECTLYCNLQSRARTHAILVIHVGLYELLGNLILIRNLFYSPFWYVMVWEIWGNPIMGHIQVTLYNIQWKWWLRTMKMLLSNLFFILRAIWFAEKNCNYI